MDLYILRHAIADQKNPFNMENDSDRPLTEEGAEKMRLIARALKSRELSFDIILSSPFRRAKETAEIVAEVFKCKDVVKFSSHLEVGGNPLALVNEINKHYADLGSILLVGHEPYLSRFISVLLSGDGNVSVAMKKGGICKLVVSGGFRYGRCATLEWLLPPAIILLGK